MNPLILFLLVAAQGAGVSGPACDNIPQRLDSSPKHLFLSRSDQPDTIYYDDWEPYWAYTAVKWGAVRFTALAPFELRTVIYDIYNVAGSDDSFYIFIYDTLDGNIIGGPYGLVHEQGFLRIQVDVPDSFFFSPWRDFYVVIGPQKWFTLNSIVFDDETETFRSYVWFSEISGWVPEFGGDLCLRVAGEYLCGEINCDGKVDIQDLIQLVNFLFGFGDLCSYWAADVNGDDTVTYLDVIMLANYLFAGGTLNCPEEVFQ